MFSSRSANFIKIFSIMLKLTFAKLFESVIVTNAIIILRNKMNNCHCRWHNSKIQRRKWNKIVLALSKSQFGS